MNICKDGGADPFRLEVLMDMNALHTVFKKRADFNLFRGDGAGPLYVACHDGHKSSVQLL